MQICKSSKYLLGYAGIIGASVLSIAAQTVRGAVRHTAFEPELLPSLILAACVSAVLLAITFPFAVLLCLLLIVPLRAVCKKAQDSFVISAICECKEVYQIYYSCYFDDEYYGMGGMAGRHRFLKSHYTTQCGFLSIAY